MKILIYLFSAAFLMFSQGVMAQMVDYQAVYKSGDSTTLKKNTKLKITKTDDKYQFTALDGGSQSELPVEVLRGAQAGAKGVWIYWFSGDNTLNAYFEMDAAAGSSLVNQITSDVTNFHTAPVLSAEEAKSRYEQYHQQAIKEAR